MSKFENRILAWSSSQLGLNHASLAYNTFAATVLSYLWQLAEPHGDAYKLERMAARKLVPGPGQWIQPCDLWTLREGWGFNCRFISIKYKALAAAVRVCMMEASDFKHKHTRLRDLVHASNELVVRSKWKDWFDSSFYTHLHNSYIKVKAAGISPTRTLVN
ncbi:MAG: hypothetical protein ACKPKO_00665, partial [Candidatus Fonsibacter sp.]